MGRVIGRILAVLLVAVFFEQVILFLAGRSIASDQTLVPRFVADLKRSEGGVTDACRRYDTFVFYSFRMCADRVPGRDYYHVRVEFPAGYLTLIPRDYTDRILFDGKTLAFVSSAGFILEDLTDDRN